MSMRLGVTGGIGSGKSTVCSLLAQGGAVVIDADAISRACTAPQGPAIAAIVQAFGPSVLSAPGVLDRDVLRVCEYFATCGVHGDPMRLANSLWEDALGAL